MTADRATVGFGLAIRRWANRPPSRRRKPAHRTILASAPRPLAALAIGVGLSAAALLAARELRRPGVPPQTDPPEGQPTAPHKLALHDGERTADGIRRMSIAQLDLAIATLQQATGSDIEEAVHETRKAIKRLRTMERLAAGAGKRSVRERRKDLLRGAAGELSGARDAQVALNTLEGLMRRAPRLNGSPGVARLHAALLAEHTAAERALQESGAHERALRLLQEARAGFDDDRAGAGRVRAVVLEAGITRIYTRGRIAMRSAGKRKGIAEMHEWRKRVKDLRYAAEALGEGNGASATKPGKRRARLRRIGRDADSLGEALGEEHDLALLARRVSGEEATFRGDKAGRKELQQAIRRRRRRLRRRAFSAGSVLYRAKPRRFRKRLPKGRR